MIKVCDANNVIREINGAHWVVGPYGELNIYDTAPSPISTQPPLLLAVVAPGKWVCAFEQGPGWVNRDGADGLEYNVPCGICGKEVRHRKGSLGPIECHDCKPVAGSLLDEANAQNERLRGMLTWRPIVTAPRDGTRVLACRMRGDKMIIQGSTLFNPNDGKWFVAGTNMEANPTHWLPLLPGPKDAL